MQKSEHAGEAGLSVAVLRREVGAGVKGLEVGGEKNGVGPAALAGDDLGGGHVNLVEVGPFFAIHFNIDKPLVHELGDVWIGKDFALHDVAPITGGVSHRQENGFVFAARPFYGLGAPGIPLDGVVDVEQEVGAGFVGQVVGRVGGGDLALIRVGKRKRRYKNVRNGMMLAFGLVTGGGQPGGTPLAVCESQGRPAWPPLPHKPPPAHPPADLNLSSPSELYVLRFIIHAIINV